MKIQPITLALAALAALGTACTNDDDRRITTDADAVQITTTQTSGAHFAPNSAAPLAATRADAPAAPYTPADGSTLVLANALPRPHATQRTTFIYSSAAAWQVAPGFAPLYWDDLTPQATGTDAYAFYALAPATHPAAQPTANPATDLYTVATDQSTPALLSAQDLLVAYTPNATRKAPVALNLRHPLAKLRIRLTRMEGIPLDMSTAAITIAEAKPGYTLAYQADAAAPVLATVSGDASQTPFRPALVTLAATSATSADYELLLPPLQAATLKIAIAFARTNAQPASSYTYTATLSATPGRDNCLEAGSATTFALSVDRLRLIPTGVFTEDWELLPDGGDAPDTNGTTADGTRPLASQATFDPAADTWIIYGGGTEEKDALVLQNLCTELDKIYKAKFDDYGVLTNAPYAGTRRIHLVMEGVSSLPKINSDLVGVLAGYGQLASVSAPSVTSVNVSVFHGCTNLTAISLPEATTIDEGAFQNCTKLTTISLPKATTIVDYAFQDCKALTTVNLPEATTIGKYAFVSCEALTTISLPKATTINQSAFQSCTALTTLSLPEAEAIGEGVFEGCPTLTTVSLPKATTIGDNAFNGCTNLTTISLPKAEAINESAFQSCTNLTTVSLPETTTIGKVAFQYCNALTTITLPKAEAINESAFSDCTNLTTVTLPKATTIGRQAFVRCKALTTVTLSKATTIGDVAFQGCTALTTLTLNAAGNISLHADVFSGFTTPLSCTLTLHPDKKHDAAGTVTPKVKETATGNGDWRKWGADGKEAIWKAIEYLAPQP